MKDYKLKRRNLLPTENRSETGRGLIETPKDCQNKYFRNSVEKLAFMVPSMVLSIMTSHDP